MVRNWIDRFFHMVVNLNLWQFATLCTLIDIAMLFGISRLLNITTQGPQEWILSACSLLFLWAVVLLACVVSSRENNDEKNSVYNAINGIGTIGVLLFAFVGFDLLLSDTLTRNFEVTWVMSIIFFVIGVIMAYKVNYSELSD